MNGKEYLAWLEKVETAREAARQDLLATLANTGAPKAYATETGGGCRAYVIVNPDGRELYVTNGDACLPYQYMGMNEVPGVSDDTDLYFGYFDADAEEDGFVSLPSSECSETNISRIVKAWLEGNPERE